VTGRRHSTPRHPEPCRAAGCGALIWFKTVTVPGSAKTVRLPLLAAPDPAGTIAEEFLLATLEAQLDGIGP
jgi:hypothetical protein